MAFEGGGRGERGIVERSEEFTTVQRRLNDSAVEIGREFERMINKYGCQAVDGILPRVTYIMEQLDSLSETNSMIRNENEELKIKLNHYERQEKNRKKLEADFEFIETNLTEELLELRNENYQLKHSSASSKHFDTIDFVASSTSSPGYSLESVDSIEFQRENGGKIYLQDKLHEKERQVRELKYQVSQSLAQRNKLQEMNEQLKFALHISGDEIERMTELIDSMDKTLVKTLKDNQEMSLSMEGYNSSRRRKSCPGGNVIALSEVRKIFLERNDLKYQLESLRRKFISLKEKKDLDKSAPLQIPGIESKCIQTEDGIGLDPNGDEESVQGPVYKEPLEKIFFFDRSKSFRFRILRWLVSDLYD